MNTSSSYSDGSPSKKRAKVECSYGERCYRKKPEHFQEFTHSHLNKLLEGMGDKITIPSNYNPKISKQTLTEQLEMIKKLIPQVIPDKIQETSQSSPPSKKPKKEVAIKTPPKNVRNSPSCSRTENSPSSSSSPDKNTPSPHKKNGSSEVEPRNERWDAHMAQYKKEAFKKINISVKEKMEAAAPYNIFLTTIKDSPKTHKEPLSISFPELLDPYFGELESSLQINFMVEFGFLLAQYSITGHKSRPLTLLYGDIDCELDRFSHFLTHAKVIPPSSFGSHHTKMMVFRYTNKSIRVVVSTANLVESDWENRTQGLWISPECPVLDSNQEGAGESVTNFKKDFIAYLLAYNLPCLNPWIEALKGVDMSPIKVFFIGSVPGSHTTYKNNWGQLKLAKLLKENVSPNEGNIIAQCSSIGSLGPNPGSWLQGEMLRTFEGTKAKKQLSYTPDLKLVYPTFNCISKSYDGLLGGGCLPYTRKVHKKQEWLVANLCDWYSEKRHRTRAPPHIKSYCRVSKDHHKLYYFVLTSANMSKAAWGQQAKSGSLNILSYEAGILLIPQILISKDYIPLVEEEDGSKVFSLPYDLPLVKYTYKDVPWFMDNLM